MSQTQPQSSSKGVLGKGLASLLPGAGPVSTPATPIESGAVEPVVPVVAPVAPQASRDRHPGISFVALDEIQVNPYQPRRQFDEASLSELTQSIQANGIIQPLVLRKTENGYQLIAGERRFRAAKKAGLKQVPAVIRRSTDRESLELAIVENVQREDLNCVDAALAYFRLQEEFHLTQEEIALRVGKDRATVSNHLRLLKLSEAAIEDLKKGVLSFGHGKILLSIEDTELRAKLRFEMVDKKLSVRESEELAARMRESAAQAPLGAAKGSAQDSDPISRRFEALTRELTRKWAARVELKGSEKRGKIMVHYRSKDELERLLETMQSEAVWRAGRT